MCCSLNLHGPRQSLTYSLGYPLFFNIFKLEFFWASWDWWGLLKSLYLLHTILYLILLKLCERILHVTAAAPEFLSNGCIWYFLCTSFKKKKLKKNIKSTSRIWTFKFWKRTILLLEVFVLICLFRRATNVEILCWPRIIFLPTLWFNLTMMLNELLFRSWLFNIQYICA